MTLRFPSGIMILSGAGNVLPRLNDIESCYTDTFNRYKAYADKMDSVFEDTELLKTVVTNHSEQLQKLA